MEGGTERLGTIPRVKARQAYATMPSSGSRHCLRDRPHEDTQGVQFDAAETMRRRKVFVAPAQYNLLILQQDAS